MSSSPADVSRSVGAPRTADGAVSPRAIPRRALLRGLGIGGGALGLVTVARRALGAQETPAANFAPMEQGAYRPTLRDPKPDATPRLTDADRDALEHRIKCQCGCILDIYTCRTTDFTCQVSPAMHRDVMRLVAGGYEAEEILEAFVATYGEVALTAPKKEGFNWAGYLAPGIAMATGAVALTILLRKWAREARTAAAARPAGGLGAATLPGVSAEELSRLDRALREEG
ncbi:MAG: cytochrome c-type biogenesis protein CcmH [Gemmatimonadota bacterium]|nr:cytochrome c-type biogenesis protein CcmH [Gemmatimonadota bacterium]MDQ8147496.1 cytochrome c-type biogenesis protein CcmH [Gemmatimonadota bacterium]MDQ8149433.1 cytochrome c-type biogenesis protein CcmH [Gemmatimonadota bacterium]MDQ8157596.1 cytochrome c-type biogenesis protein CcmH [Gemmatimonadota bacterium]MDQ8176902.1 cytochrome c-type biogenesis protein CcmH [Gemmatimonadota bacterium]